MAKTLSEKVWDRHVVHRGGTSGEPDLLYIDLHLVHEVTSPQAFDGLRIADRPVRRPDLTVATEDHNVPTTLGPIEDPISLTQVETLRANAAEFGIRLHSMGDPGQGIVHIIGPEQGLTQPGMTIVCGDSHTSTHGAFGALAFGIGTSEVEHVLATQTLPQRRPGTMAVTVDGDLPAGVTAKDIVLAIIGRIGTGGGIGSVIEYRGSAIRALSMEGRMTVCNMSIEAGARAGLVAPDETTFAYLEGRPSAPTGAAWDEAVADWRTLVTDDDAVFDKEVVIDAATLSPARDLGDEPGPGHPPGRRRALPRRLRRGVRARRRRAGAGLHGPRGGHPDAGREGRHRLHRLLHQRPHRGPPGRGRGGRGSAGGRRGPDPGRPRLGQGQGAGRGRGPRPDPDRRRLRLAPAGLLDVPGHEPRQAGGRRARRLDQQPQLRGPPGPGWAYPPRLPGGGRGHRHRRHLRHPRRPGASI